MLLLLPVVLWAIEDEGWLEQKVRTAAGFLGRSEETRFLAFLFDSVMVFFLAFGDDDDDDDAMMCFLALDDDATLRLLALDCDDDGDFFFLASAAVLLLLLDFFAPERTTAYLFFLIMLLLPLDAAHILFLAAGIQRSCSSALSVLDARLYIRTESHTRPTSRTR